MKKILIILLVLIVFMSCEMYQGTYVSYNISVPEGDIFEGTYISSTQESIDVSGETYISINEFIPHGSIVGLSAKNATNNNVTIYVHFKTSKGWRSYDNISGVGTIEIHGKITY